MDQRHDFKELIRKATSGDEGAARMLVARYSPILRIIIERYHRNDVSDVSQEVWLAFHEQAQKGTIQAETFNQFMSLLRRMAYNEIVSRWRAMATIRRGGKCRRVGHDALEAVVDKAPGASELARREEEAMAFWSHLEAPERQLVEMRLDGYTNGQIAEVMKCTEGAIAARFNRMRRRLEGTGIRGGSWVSIVAASTS